jgi:2'-5' RNA ligase
VHILNCEELQKEIDNSLKNLFPREERFMGHATIARVKAINEKRSFIERIKSIKPRFKEFEVKTFVLKKSILTPEGPTYEDVETFEFNKFLE